MKVYRRMDIGTAKPSAERLEQVKYHMIDIVEPSESFSVDRFLEMSGQCMDKIAKSGKPILAAGGTAMYIKAMLHGIFDGPGSDREIRERLKRRIEVDGLGQLHDQLKYVDPAAAERIHPNDQKRIVRALEVYELTGKGISSFQNQFDQPIDEDWTIIGIRRDKEVESRRINTRVKKMVELGLVDEVKSLISEPEPLSEQAACAIGYAEIIRHLKGELELDDAIEQIKINTRKLAKAQRTWFKRFENVKWFDVGEDEKFEDVLEKVLKVI